MADVERIVDIVLRGRDEVSDTLRKVKTAFGGVEDIAEPFAQLGNAVLAADAAVAAVGASILNVRDDFKAAGLFISSSLNGTAEEMEDLAEVARRVFAGGFGESIQEAAQAVVDVQSRLKDFNLSLQDIDFAASMAFSIQDLFGAGVDESLGAVRTLMQNFGLDVQESFDFISTGFRDGLNASGDFLESITEYSTQFANGGASAEQFFSVMSSGLQDGILGTDKAADAFKEFRVRIQDGSKTTKDALEAIGINAEDLGRKMSAGTVSAVDAFQLVIEKLRDTKDTSIQLQSGVGLLGTQFEDLGTAAALALDTTTKKMSDMAGATEQNLRQYETLGKAITGVFRSISSEIGAADAFGPLEDQIVEFLDRLKVAIPEAFDRLDFSGVVDGIDDLFADISRMFGNIDLGDADQLTAVVQEIIDSVESLVDVTGGIAEAWGPPIRAIGEAIRWFNDLDGETKELIGNLLGVSQQAVIIGGGFAAIGAAISGMSTLLGPASAAVAAFAGPLGLGAIAAAAGAAAGSLIRELVPGVDQATMGFLAWTDSIVNFSGTQGRANESVAEAQARIRAEVEEMRALREESKATADGLQELSDKGQIDISVNADVDAALGDFFAELDDAAAAKPIRPSIDLDQFDMDMEGFKALYGYALDDVNIKEDGTYDIQLKPGVDTDALGRMTGIIEETLPDGTRTFTYLPELDERAMNDVKQKVDDAIPPDKKLEIQAELDIAQIQADADVMAAQIEATSEQIQAAIEWQAKLDIAEVEANAKIMESMFENLNTIMNSTGDTMSDLFGMLSGDGVLFGEKNRKLMEQINEESRMRAEAHQKSMDVMDLQMRMWEAQLAQLESGEGLNITVEANNLSAPLEMIFEEVIRLAHAKGIENQARFLTQIAGDLA